MSLLLDIVKKQGKAMDIYEIAGAAGRPIEEVNEELSTLIRQGGVVLTKKGKYALPEDVGLIPARTVVLRSGAPVARPLDKGEDMLIRERGSLRPMVDDLILVRPEPTQKNDRSRCQLVAITQRAHEEFMAVLTMVPVETTEPVRKKAKKGRRKVEKRTTRTTYVPKVRPVDPRITTKIELENGLQNARDGDMVLLKVVSWPERGVKLRAVIERVMGDADDIQVRLRAIASSHGLHEDFPPEAIRQADAVPMNVDEADLLGRMDLRYLTLFTIDGEDAQDFDDAVSLEKTENGWKLGVHIADVSHYVRRKTPIDTEALERGTSVYLPGLTLPMLPEALSNRMCSLMPDVDRLAMSLILELKDGIVVDHALSPSVIHSRARLTYTQVNHMLEGSENDIPSELHEVLHQMAELAKTLREKRHARGSIDFDLPEAAFTLDSSGHPTDVRARNRGEAERMIEDFMLLANETIAEIARTAELPFLYRTHGKPDSDRVRSLEIFLRGLGVQAKLGDEPSPMQFQKILSGTAEMNEAELIKQVMLRSLRRAEYSAVPEGHFGLAARDYCHFTSPIRRYPDLEVHRMLKLFLSGGAKSYAQQEKRMPELAKQCSACEQKATLAERDADDLLKADYMAKHVGEEYNGVVTGVTGWGFYVTLQNTVEGLVPIRTLDGYYELDEDKHTLKSMNGQPIRLGDAVTIRVESVNRELSQIDFTLLKK